jgi:CHAD domain-containing protein
LKKEKKFIIRSYAAKVIQSQIIYLKTQLNGMQIENDIEFLHHTRVMSRRIRSSIEVFIPYFGKKNSQNWIDSFQKLTKSLTKIRDLDVQIRFLESQLTGIYQNNIQQGINRLLLRKKQKRLLAQNNVSDLIIDFENSNVMEEVFLFIEKHPFDEKTFYPPKELVDIARQNINDQLKKCFLYVPFITNPNNIHELHDLRISIKNLRYTTEVFESLYPDLIEFLNVLKIFQDDLGRIHDDDIWIIEFDDFLEKEKKRIEKFYGQSGPINFIKPGIEYLKNLIVNDRILTYETFIGHWNDHFQQQFWSRLRDQIIEFPKMDLKPIDETDAIENTIVESNEEKLLHKSNLS